MNVVNAGSRYQIYGEDVKTFRNLPPATYSVAFHPQMGFWLEHRPDLSTYNINLQENRISDFVLTK